MTQKNPSLHLFTQTFWLLLCNNGFCEEYEQIIFPVRWCIQSVFGTKVYQEAERLLTFTCYISHICVLYISYVCVCYAEWNFNYSHCFFLCALWCFPLLTVFALVDNSEFARCWLFKSGRRPPQGGNVWGFCPNVGTNFFRGVAFKTNTAKFLPCLQRFTSVLIS